MFGDKLLCEAAVVYVDNIVEDNFDWGEEHLFILAMRAMDVLINLRPLNNGLTIINTW